MNCIHQNPPGYAFCGTCGAPIDSLRCRCGFSNSLSNRYCGNCGLELASINGEGRACATAVSGKYNLDELVKHLAKVDSPSADSAKASQEDIAAIIAAMRGGEKE